MSEHPDVNALEGRALDVAVAREVFGLTDVDYSASFHSVPTYSTDIEQAWFLLERVQRQLGLRFGRVEWRFDDWMCKFGGRKRFWEVGHGATAPEAICRAALVVCRARAPVRCANW